MIVHLDDYFSAPEKVPKTHGMLNYDHPDALDLNKLAGDLASLKTGNPVTINTKDHRVKGEYGEESRREPKEFLPKRLIVVEGFLTLWSPKVRKFLDLKIYLDAPFELHLERRIHFMIKGYTEKVLKPMHDKYVSASKRYADKVIEVSELSPEQVLDEVKTLLPRKAIS